MNFLELSQEERIATRRARILKALEMDKELNARVNNHTNQDNGNARNKVSNDNNTDDTACNTDDGGKASSDNVTSVSKAKNEIGNSPVFSFNDYCHSNNAINKTSDYINSEVRRARTEMYTTYTNMEEALTNVKDNVDTAENVRRRRNKIIENKEQAEQLKLEEENEMNATAIKMKFEALFALTIPHELHAAIEEQREACASLLSRKEEIIHRLQSDLISKEKEYVELLKRNKEEVDQLIETMHNTTNEYTDTSANQLQEVESTFLNERNAFIAKCDAEINELIKMRRAREMEYRRQRENKLVDAQDNLLQKHNEMYEEFNNVQNAHYTEINLLRQELEKCKADFMLNGERLSYNLQVLRERVKENTATENTCKRKLARLQETLSALIGRHKEAEKKFEKQNKELTTQLHRVGTQYKDMQEKFQLFEHNDKDKYRQLWTSHDKKCKALVHRVLQADRVVFEDVLQMPWSPPEISFGMESTNGMPMYGSCKTSQRSTNNGQQTYTDKLKQNGVQEQITITNNRHDNFNQEDNFYNDYYDDDDDDKDDDEEGVDNNLYSEGNGDIKSNNAKFDSGTIERKFIMDAGVGAMTGADITNANSSSASPPAPLDLNESELVLLNILRSQAPFLVDANVRAAIEQINGTTAEQAEIEGILTTLQINKNDELQNMLEYFMVEGDYNSRALIHPQECLRALNAFLNERTAKQVAAAQRKANRVRMTSKIKEKAKRAVENALAEENYWKSLTTVIPEPHVHIWEALEKGLETYLAQLQQRKGLIETADALRTQNSQLKNLIQQYMQSDINYQLYSMPRLIRQANESASSTVAAR